MTYFGEVQWRSPGNNLVQFEDSGEISVTDTTVTVSPLVPGTNYLIRVSAVTPSGRGAEVPHYGTTKIPALDGKKDYAIIIYFSKNLYIYSSGKLAYFQLRMSPISNCLSFVVRSIHIPFWDYH